MPRFKVIMQTAYGMAVANLESGNIYYTRFASSNGLNDFNWDKFGNFFQQAWGPIAEGLKNKLSGPAYSQQSGGGYYPSSGAVIQASPQGAFGSIDSTTIMLLGGAVLVGFLALKK